MKVKKTTIGAIANAVAIKKSGEGMRRSNLKNTYKKTDSGKYD